MKFSAKPRVHLEQCAPPLRRSAPFKTMRNPNKQRNELVAMIRRCADAAHRQIAPTIPLGKSGLPDE
eukprot:444965-Pyramimonas_sp.AAC.1